MAALSPATRANLQRTGRGLLVWAVAWGAMLALDPGLDLANLALVLVLAAAVAGLWWPPFASALASAVAVLAFNWTFVPVVVPAGTFVAAGEQAFATQADVTVPRGRLTLFGTIEAGEIEVDVVAAAPGPAANVDAQAINVAPLNNVPGAVVSLMERSNVETVIVAGKVRKWKGRLLDVNLGRLRRELEASRDYLFEAAAVPQDLFRPN